MTRIIPDGYSLGGSSHFGEDASAESVTVIEVIKQGVTPGKRLQDDHPLVGKIAALHI